jgi:F-type H+-transporting ATPase subunit alpha
MSIKADEITKIIQQQIEGYDTGVDIREVGTVTSVGDGIAHVYGLDRVMSNELLEFPRGVFGLALNSRRRTSGPSSSAKATSSAKGTSSSGPAGSCRSRPDRP